MLRFIVLGEVPGTQIQINFGQLAILFVLAALVYEMLLSHRRHLMAEATAVKTSVKRPNSTKKSAGKSKTAKKSQKSKAKQKQA